MSVCVCVLEMYCLLSFLCVSLSSIHSSFFALLCFGYCTCNALESNTVYSSVFVSWSCLRAVKARGGKSRGIGEGEHTGCQGKRRLCLMRSRPGNPVAPPT